MATTGSQSARKYLQDILHASVYVIAGLAVLMPSASTEAQDGESLVDLVVQPLPASAGSVDASFGSFKATISLLPEKPTWYLGEQVQLHWRVVAAGELPVSFDFGGDGRNAAGRALRFRVEANNAAGQSMPDPWPVTMSFGGLGSSPTLQPGEEHRETILLMRYREIVTPGEYAIRVYHDLGWKQSEQEIAFGHVNRSDIPPEPRTAPVVTTSVRFLMPDEEHARDLVNEMLGRRPESGRFQFRTEYADPDFKLLRYPVYLPIMKELVEEGDVRGLDAIGAMAFPAATAVLLDLMQHSNPEVAGRAGDTLLRRIPSLYGMRDMATRSSYLGDRSWTDDLRKRAAEPAWQLLAGEDREGIIRGAKMLGSLGSKDDLPALIQVMDRVLAAFAEHEVEQRAWLRPATASQSLERVAAELLRRGAPPPESATTPGESVAWLLCLGSDENFRPDGWRETARELIRHEIPFIRDVALRNLPLPLDESTAAVVVEAIHDEFAPVQGAACRLAGESGMQTFAASLTKLLRRTQNPWLLDSAFAAALECGVPNDRRLEICLRRMNGSDNDWNMRLMRLLIDGAIETSGHGARSIDNWSTVLTKLRAAWREFIEAHREELREGARFPVGDPPLTPAMFPPGFHLYRDGQAWPKEN